MEAIAGLGRPGLGSDRSACNPGRRTNHLPGWPARDSSFAPSASPDRDRLSHRALEFERFHNANHRYRATGKRTPDELTAGIERRAPTPLSELPPGWPKQGRIEFIRFIRSDRKLRLLRRSIELPETQVYRYVTAALDLSVAAEEGNLLVADHDGELIATQRAASRDMIAPATSSLASGSLRGGGTVA